MPRKWNFITDRSKEYEGTGKRPPWICWDGWRPQLRADIAITAFVIALVVYWIV